jgi:hypothetical protein
LHRVFLFHYFKVARFQGIKIVKFQVFYEKFLSFEVSRFQCFVVSINLAFKVSGFQYFLVSRNQGFNLTVSGFRGSKKSSFIGF